MTPLMLSDEQAKRMYPTASDEIKIILEQTFGGKHFFSGKIKDWLKTFEDACKADGTDPADQRFTTGPLHEIAARKLELIIKVANKGWKADLKDKNQYKYYPYFYYNDTGFRRHVVYYVSANSDVGSRFCFENSADAEYIATQFIDLYEDYITK